MSCLCILEIKPLLVASFADISSQCIGCLFVLWFPLLCKSFYVWLGPICLFLVLLLLPWEMDLRKILLLCMSGSVLPMFPSRSFMVLCLIFRSLNRFEFIFLRIGRLWGLQAGGQEGAVLWELSGLRFYNQRKSGEREKTTVFLILEWTSSFHRQLLLHVGWFPCPYIVKPSKKIVTYT